MPREHTHFFGSVQAKARYILHGFRKQDMGNSRRKEEKNSKCKCYTDNDDTTRISDDERTRRQEERYGSPLHPRTHDNTTTDLCNNGSPFITDWVLFFSNGKLKLSFNRVCNALIDGIHKEGTMQSEPHLEEIISFLQQTKDNTTKIKAEKRMVKLQEACAKLYTKHGFLFEMVNRTLRENDRSKLTTLGPFCYLVYTYIGSQEVFRDSRSLRYLWRQQVNSTTESPAMIVYRGDRVTDKQIEEYRQAAGVQNKYFKWVTFVSTSFDESVAKSFGINVLYVIELHRELSNDQFVYLGHISYYAEEKEVLLLPGIRFRVKQVEDMKSGEKNDRFKVYITIEPSFISNLM